MNSFKSLLSVLLIAFVSVFALSCKDDDPEPEAVVASTFTDLSADPGTGVNPNTGQPTGITNKFTLFSFKTGAIVPNADSATTKWDVGFRRTTIIINGGTSGPGTAGAIIQTKLFDEVTEAPADGYAVDNKTANPAYAIPTGSGKGWYTYNGATNLITPTAGKVLIFRTADNKYAKVEILSYYKGNKATPTSTDASGFYSFKYVYQPNESTKFSN
ncbi:MAG TPA: HmuY family protein [Cyclobacteriaceae bacterium]